MSYGYPFLGKISRLTIQYFLNGLKPPTTLFLLLVEKDPQTIEIPSLPVIPCEYLWCLNPTKKHLLIRRSYNLED